MAPHECDLPDLLKQLYQVTDMTEKLNTPLLMQKCLNTMFVFTFTLRNLIKVCFLPFNSHGELAVFLDYLTMLFP